jgi:hypothetical protein
VLLYVSANILLQEKILLLGLSWRWSAAAAAMAGIQITNGLFVGYSYVLKLLICLIIIVVRMSIFAI